ncbi:MAG: hypothetical protein DCC67_09995 [Planctomycetota bacterium]|nr:MAG: hypothetical protein DCC67_09995 [Planctomycetota bacterium]
MANPQRTALFVRRLAAACALGALAAAGGCRNLDNAQMDVLERELRQQEDYIYELEGCLAEYSEKLRQARLSQRPPAAAKRGVESPVRPEAREPTLDVDPPAAPLPPPSASDRARPLTSESTQADAAEAPPATAPPAARPQQEPVPDVAMPTPGADEAPPAEPPAAEPEPVDPSEMEAPELEIGPEAGAAAGAGASPLATAEPAADGPLLIPDPIDYQAEAAAPPVVDQLADSSGDDRTWPLAEGQPASPTSDASRLRAERLEIRRVFGEPLSEEDAALGKLLVVVEALTSANEPAGVEGEVSLMIMTRDAPNSFQRIDRWDFTPQETAAAWQSSELGDGLHLELPLHLSELPGGELQLWARVVTPDGRKLLTQIPFDPSQLASLSATSESAGLAAAEPPLGGAGADAARPIPTRPIDESAEPAVKPRPQWRAATARVDAGSTGSGHRTAEAEGDDAWEPSPSGGTEPRVEQASTAAPPHSQWKRSAAPASDATPVWGRR